MTVVSTKSISGVTSITSPQADDAITLHTNDTTQRVSVTTGGMNVTGVITATSFDAPVTGDFSIADKIVHTGDTNTAIRFPAADTFTIETSGTERVRVSSGGSFGINCGSLDNAVPARDLEVASSDGAILRLSSSDDSLAAGERLGAPSVRSGPVSPDDTVAAGGDDG